MATSAVNRVLSRPQSAIQSADLSVTNSDYPDPVKQGSPLTYTVTIVNNGLDTAQTVLLTDTLPGEVSFNFAVITNGYCAKDLPLLICQLGPMDPGETKTLTIRVTPNVPGTITNHAVATTATSDPNTANNAASQDTTVIPLLADLSVINSDHPDPVTQGSPLTYTVTIVNNGLDTAQTVLLTDTLPGEVSFNFAVITNGYCAKDLPLLICQLGPMDPGETKTLTIRVTPNVPGTITNHAVATTATSDPNTANNSVSQDTTVNALPATCHWTGPKDNVPRDWASVAFWDCGQIPGPGDAAVIDGYGRKVNLNAPVTVERFALINSSSIDAYQTLTVTGAMEWDGEIVGGGHLSPAGALESLVIAPGAVLSITNPGPDSRLLRGRLVNYGAVEHTAGKTLRLFYAAIDNRAGGVYRVSSGRIDKANPYGSPDDGGWFDNAGALVKAGDGQFVLHAALSNSGQVTVSQDILRVEMSADVQVVTHTGAFFIAAPGTLLLAGHEHRFAAASSIAGPGVLRLDSADAVVRGEYRLTGLTDLWFGADLHLETAAGAVSLPRVYMGNSSRLLGSNAITVTQALTMSGSGAVAEGTGAASSSLDIAPGARVWVQDGGLSARTLNNYGAIEVASGGCFVLRNDAVFNNQPSGVFTVTTGRMDPCEPWPASRNGVVNNYGRFVKLGLDDFTVDYHISLNNAGSLEVWDGALRADGPFRQTAGETFLDGGTLRNSNYNLAFDGGKLRGNGAISLWQDRWLQNNAAIVQPTGLLSLDQHYSQGVSGTLQSDIGGLVPGAGYGVFQVARQAALDGRLVLSPTNNFLPASGDLFRVMEYGSRGGEFAQVERGLGLAFGPEYQSDGVVISDNPALVEFSQRPDRRTVPPASASGFSLRLTNTHSETVAAAFQNVLPAGFVFLDGSATSNLPLSPPSVTLNNGSQTLLWPPLEIASGAVVTIHFGVAVPQMVGVYTNTAQVAVTPTLAAPRTLRLYAQVDVSLSPMRNTLIEVTNGVAYPSSEPDGLWTIAVRKGTSAAVVGVKITSTPVCVLSACGPLKRFNALHAGQIFPLTLVSGTTDRYRAEIPQGQFDLFERIFLDVVFDPPTGGQRAALSPDDGAVGGKPVTTQPKMFDPSGLVTDAATGAPLPSATVTLYRVAAAWPDTRNTTRDCRTVESRPGGLAGLWSSLPPAAPGLGLWEDPLFAPAVIDPAINPQITDADGRYGWDVVRGCWYVKVEAAGYATAYSPVVGVPPEVTDLDIQLEPLPAPPPVYIFLPIILR